MDALAIRTLQTALGFGAADVDGELGSKTRDVLNAALAGLPLGNEWQHWPDARQAVLFLQSRCLKDGFEPGELDGWWGPGTAHAVSQLAYFQHFGQAPAPWREESVPANPNGWPLERRSDLTACYGEPGESGLVACPLPYPLRIAWNPAVRIDTLRCHAKVRASLERVLAAVLAVYGKDRLGELGLDLFGGCYQLRAKRGGTALSTHAWGIALDFDPDHNQLRWNRDRAHFARPEYDAWWRCWEDEGWVSLGRTRNYDWMHVQAARI